MPFTLRRTRSESSRFEWLKGLPRALALMVLGMGILFPGFPARGEPLPWIKDGVSLRLLQTLRGRDASERMTVIFYLRSQPGAPVAREVFASYEPIIRNLQEEARWAWSLTRPSFSVPDWAEPDFLMPNPLSEAQLRDVAFRLDAVRDAMRAEIAARASLLVQDDHKALSEAIQRAGGRVLGSTVVLNTVTAEVPAGKIRMLARHPLVAFAVEDNPGFPELDNQVFSLGVVNGFWAGNYTGGPHDVGVLDTGVQQDHPNLRNHRFESNRGTTDPDGHGTAIAGMYASDHETYRGLAFGLDTIAVATAGGDSTSMSGMHFLMTGTTERPENVNYSFGNGRANDVDYSAFDAFFDGVIDTFFVMVAKSTGNGGYGVTTITHPAPAYNLIATANMNDRDTVTRTDDIIDSTSSRGPTLGGRKKPDVTAPGTNTMSTNNAWATGGLFRNLGGTSSAAPKAGSGAILLASLGLVHPFAIKAVLLNSAQAWTSNNTQTTSDDGPVPGSHWDVTFGWGYLDLYRAYFNGLDVFVDTVDSPSRPGTPFRFYVGPMFAYEKATLVWHRHVAYNGSAYPNRIEDLSNLDLFLYDQSTGNLLASSTSPRDNVEQVHTPINGVIVIKVKAAGPFDPDIPVQAFALATEENFARAEGPSLRVRVFVPGSVRRNEVFGIDVEVKNEGDLPAFGVLTSLQTTNLLLLSAGAMPVRLNPGESVVYSWKAVAFGMPGSYARVIARANSTSFQENFSGEGEAQILIVP